MKTNNQLQIQFRLFCLAGFIALFALPLCSQERNGVITAIEITGLKRTKPHIARYPLERFLGREGAGLDMSEVQAAVKDTGILEPVGEELIETDDGLILHVTVREKWSIFPAPMLMANAGDFNAGFFFMDTNAFGLRDQMGLGGMYGTSGWMAIAMYHLTPDRKGLPGFSSVFTYYNRERKDLDKYENIHRRYTTEQFRLYLGVNYPLTSYFTVFTALSFTNISLKKNSDTLNSPEKGAMVLGVSPGLSLRQASWDGFLLSQKSLSLSYGYNYVLSGAGYHQVDFRGTFEQPLVPGFRINLQSGAIWKSETDVLFEEGPQKAHVDILPRRYSARHYAGLSAGLEKYIFRASWGTLSAMASWQAALSYGPISGGEFNHGPSGVIRFYLSRLAMPAFGIGTAYNMNSHLFQMAINIGMEF